MPRRPSPAGARRFRPRSTLRGMDNIQDQIRVLETSFRRQRFAIVALASILAGSALIFAVRPAGDATFDTITCKEWRVVDKDGKVRIAAGTAPDGIVGLLWMDKDGTGRILAATFADGDAGVAWSDKDGKTRILADTAASGTVTYPTKDGN